MRLIDADEVNPNDILIFVDGPITQEQFNCAVKSLLYGQPTIDPESLRERGKWIIHGDEILGCNCECSKCHILTFGDSPYCPHCGARMCEED